MFSNNELFEFSQVFTKYQGNFIESPHFLNVMNKLHIAKLEYIFYENGIPNDPTIFYENKDLVTGELYQTRKDLNYGIFILKTFFDKNAEITDEIREVNSYICEITYLGLSRIKLVNNALYYLLHDELTGIYNQNFFSRHVTELINKRDISEYAALYLNIRNCRYLNSVFGNRITDRIIVTLAKTLKSMIVIEDGECVSRLGGDFFTLIVKKEHLEKFTNLLTNFPIEFDYESDHIVYHL